MKSSRRIEWFLAGLLTLIILVGLGWLIWTQLFQASPTAQAPAVFTARSAYAKAVVAARGWDMEAELVSARTTWNRDAQGSYSQMGWSFVFYSAEQSATALVAVSEDSATLLNSRVSDKVVIPAAIDQWRLDSPAVIESFNDAVDQTFLDSIGEAIFTLTLNMTEPPSWSAALMNLDSGMYFGVELDASSGQTIDIQLVQ